MFCKRASHEVLSGQLFWCSFECSVAWLGRNNNSSRFGKYNRVFFDERGTLVDASATWHHLTINWMVDATGCMKLRDGMAGRCGWKLYIYHLEMDNFLEKASTVKLQAFRLGRCFSSCGRWLKFRRHHAARGSSIELPRWQHTFSKALEWWFTGDVNAHTIAFMLLVSFWRPLHTHHTVTIIATRWDRFQRCHRFGREEMQRGLDEKLAKLQLQRDKLYLLLAGDSQAWVCFTLDSNKI